LFGWKIIGISGQLRKERGMEKIRGKEEDKKRKL